APVRRRQRSLYLRYSSVAAAVAIVAVAGWLMWDRSDVVECAPGVAPTVRFVRAGGSSYVSQEMSAANDASRRSGSHVASVSSASVFSRSIADGGDVSVLDVEPTPECTTDENAVVSASTRADSVAEQKSVGESSVVVRRGSETKPTRRTDVENYRRAQNHSGWSFALAVANGFSGAGSSQSGFVPMANAAPAVGFFSDMSPDRLDFNNTYVSMMSNNISEQTKTDIEYDFPMTYAAMFRYRITDKWAVDAGVSFAVLGSSWKSGSSDSHYRIRQKVYNIGIPVSASFTFLDTRFVTMYATAGGAVEKAVDGSETTVVRSGSGDMKSVKNDLEEKPWQYSVNAGVGLQFNITNKCGIFAEPRITRHLESSDLPLRKHDTEFNLGIGLRLSY
ncbi:MAG: outer membrane beta-barrel protein, partial [Bacteroidales bacterium]|nr:outer membrane beta-barrel protein [Bacteroidales bacterium]